MRCCCGLLQTRTCVMMTTGKGAYAVFPLRSFALRTFPTGYYGRRFSTIPQSPPPHEMHHHMGRRSTTKWNRSTGAIVIVVAVAGAAGYSYYSQQDGGVPKVAVPSNWNGVQDLLRRGKLDDHEELLFTNEQVQKAWDVMRDPKGKLHTLSQEERRIYVCLELIQWAMRYQTAMSSLMMDQNKLEDTRLRIHMCIKLYNRGMEYASREATSDELTLLKTWTYWLHEVEQLLEVQEQQRRRLQCPLGTGVSFPHRKNKDSKSGLSMEPKTLHSAFRMLVQCVEGLQPAAPKIHRYFSLGGDNAGLVANAQKAVHVAAPETRNEIIEEVMPSVISVILRKISGYQKGDHQLKNDGIIKSMEDLPAHLHNYHLHRQTVIVKLLPIEEGLPSVQNPSPTKSRDKNIGNKVISWPMYTTTKPENEALFLMEMSFTTDDINRIASAVTKTVNDT